MTLKGTSAPTVPLLTLANRRTNFSGPLKPPACFFTNARILPSKSKSLFRAEGRDSVNLFLKNLFGSRRIREMQRSVRDLIASRSRRISAAASLFSFRIEFLTAFFERDQGAVALGQSFECHVNCLCAVVVILFSKCGPALGQA